MKRTSISLLLASVIIFSNFIGVKAAEVPMPKIDGKAGITMDIDTGEIIYQNNIDSRYYPASTTKLMTALIFAENKNKTDEIKYTESAKKQPQDSIDKNLHQMQIGDTMSAEDTMDALMLFSANDAANMMADSVSGNEEKFVQLMNDKVSKLGLKNTHFVTANGLHDDQHYTTPYDLSVIARAAFKNDWVQESMQKKTSKVSISDGTVLILNNRNKNLGVNGAVGGKTGYTSQAGRCLVEFYNRGGRRLVGVVMKSVYDSQDNAVFNDMEKIIDWSYKQKTVTLNKAGDTVKTETLSYKPFRFFGPQKTIDVPLVIKEDLNYYDNAVNKKEMKEDFNLSKLNLWSLSSDKPVGTMTLKEREVAKEYKLYTTVSTSSIIKANLLLYLGALIVLVLILFAVLMTILKLKNLRRRKSNRYY
ncbi:D-alanyl-D-alanine carboxypeptidase family protein [Candidatus Clostridium stratigraminis]|uniref:D-alanyl-D-alanine carboxypeptidase family protein n=1 Tax=Candidatus Clostridium stratigraminis TaxID=3381661 RepID=A0ABW8T6V2_9CLOT